MDKSIKYKSIVRSIIEEFGEISSTSASFEPQLIMDEERGQFMLLTSSWSKDSRTYGPYLHLQVKNGKIYVQYNGTEAHIAQELTNRGVDKNDIVLEFQAPYKREHTGYAVA